MKTVKRIGQSNKFFTKGKEYKINHRRDIVDDNGEIKHVSVSNSKFEVDSMSTPLDIINRIMNESTEDREVRRIIAEAQRNSGQESEAEPETEEEIEQLSDEQQGYKDTGMRPSDFY